jgi:uncharacterized protein YfaP (DUF2135 family)
MKGSFITLFALISIFANLSCKKGDHTSEIKGNPGNPRFNLQFTNEANVDLDLYVLTPNGTTVYYNNQTGQGGTLDVDCLCGDCPNGPNENIYWVEGTAPTGKYKFWVKYYGKCGNGGSVSSNYTLRLMRNSEVLQTYSGTLNSEGSISTVYSHTQ